MKFLVQTLIAAACMTSLSSPAQFVAYNDFVSGTGTHPNATTFGISASGMLKNITDGLLSGATVTITNLSASTESGAANPATGTPAWSIFHGYVDFAAGSKPSITLASTSAALGLTFTSLDPRKEYRFDGTAIKGTAAYTNRWSLFELVGAVSFANAHSTHALTTAQVPALASNQVAINTGVNHTADSGDVVCWEHIRPGVDGSFIVLSKRYSGTVPGGSSSGSTAYGISGFRLEETDISGNQLVGLYAVKTVFIILMENHSWSSIKGSANAPYINNTLLPMASYSGKYYTEPNIHPSEPNYIWLEAGTNFGILDDNLPGLNHQNTTNHLVTQLKNAGISWKSYQENIVAGTCPTSDHPPYYAKHNPNVFFTDVTSDSAYCIAHNRPYTEFGGDLTSNLVARFNFITPNITNDMHDTSPGSSSSVKQGDTWLSKAVPKILASPAYQRNGALFITWDEGTSDADGPLGMILLSPQARGGGYTNSLRYTHSATLRTFQEIFGVRPFLGAASKASDLSDLFLPGLTETSSTMSNRQFRFTVTNILPGKTNYIEASTNLVNWTVISTNILQTNLLTFTDSASNRARFFYRIRQSP